MDLSVSSLVVLGAVLVAVGGGVNAIVQTQRTHSYDTAIAYAVGGLFATLLLIALGHLVYFIEMAEAQRVIMAAAVERRAELLIAAESTARVSLYVACLGSLAALAMAIYLFGRALFLRRTGRAEQVEGGSPRRLTRQEPVNVP